MSLPRARVVKTGSKPATCFCPFCLQVKLVKPLANDLNEAIAAKIEQKTMPPGALGQLIPLATQLARQQNSLSPSADPIEFFIFAADHGLANEGVSAFPQAVTGQMVQSFLRGGAAINVFARAHQFALQIVDAGVASQIPQDPLFRALIDRSLGLGTRNMLHEPAMSTQQARSAWNAGFALAQSSEAQILGFGEMGIGNTSAAALLTAALTGQPLAHCVGRGTGLDDISLQKKLDVLERVWARHKTVLQPIKPAPIKAEGRQAAPSKALLEAIAAVGGFEIIMMAGAMAGAAASSKIVLVDGFIATSAALIADAACPDVRDWFCFAHQSAEQGHRLALAHLDAKPLLQLDLRLGEGSGAALAVPLLRSAAAFLNEMASFSSAGVSSA